MDYLFIGYVGLFIMILSLFVFGYIYKIRINNQLHALYDALRAQAMEIQSLRTGTNNLLDFMDRKYGTTTNKINNNKLVEVNVNDLDIIEDDDTVGDEEDTVGDDSVDEDDTVGAEEETVGDEDDDVEDAEEFDANELNTLLYSHHPTIIYNINDILENEFDATIAASPQAEAEAEEAEEVEEIVEVIKEKEKEEKDKIIDIDLEIKEGKVEEPIITTFISVTKKPSVADMRKQAITNGMSSADVAKLSKAELAKILNV